jgi:adenine phosphoribosyltransferase
MDLSTFIRDVPDFPTEGVVFKDIAPLLRNKNAFKSAVDWFVEKFQERGVDLVLGIEARGFLLASAVAYAMDSGLIIARKPGKLPHDVIISHTYTTEYSSDVIHVHKDAVYHDQKVLIVDDVLATGGTANAAGNLVTQLGGHVVGYSFLLELGFLNGRDILKNAEVESLLIY